MTAATPPEPRPWLVTYWGQEIRLTDDEYAALTRAAMDDPVEADRLAREHLARQREGA